MPVRLSLADFLRDHLHLTGTHLGCEHGVCGACTISMNGRSARSCLTLAVQADGAEIVTIEGLRAADGTRHPMQQAFLENFGLQCGYCTPGMLITAIELLRENPQPSEQDVREALSGNICRCTGYQAIVDSVLAVAHARMLRKSERLPDVGHALRQSESGRFAGAARRSDPAGRRRRPLSQRHPSARHVPCGFPAQPACPCTYPLGRYGESACVARRNHGADRQGAVGKSRAVPQHAQPFFRRRIRPALACRRQGPVLRRGGLRGGGGGSRHGGRCGRADRDRLRAVAGGDRSRGLASRTARRWSTTPARTII